MTSARHWKAAHCPLAVHNPRAPKLLHCCLKATADDETEIYLGDLWLPKTLPSNEVLKTLMHTYWDERLDGADCTPGYYTIPE